MTVGLVAPVSVPPGGRPYPLALGDDATADPARGLLGLAAGLTGFLVLTGLASQLVTAATWGLWGGGLDFATYARQTRAFERPEGILAAHLALAMLAVTAGAVWRVVYGRRLGWLWSVAPGVRWRYLGWVTLAAVVVLNGAFLASQGGVLPAFRPQAGAAAFLVVVALTAPIQALAEEVFFRGLVLTSIGLLVRQEWVAIVGSALIFAAFHGAQDLPLFVNRFGFGLLAGVLVWRTGGLEAGVAAHIVNNLFAFGWAALTSSIAELRAVQTLTWGASAWDLGGFLAFAAVAWAIGRRMGLALVTPARVAGGSV